MNSYTIEHYMISRFYGVDVAIYKNGEQIGYVQSIDPVCLKAKIINKDGVVETISVDKVVFKRLEDMV
jgi:hypothetical protein